MAVLKARDLTLQYGQRRVTDGLTTEIPEGKVTMIVGANACGKSTLLRGLTRLLKPVGGSVTLDGKDIHARPARELARTLGLLPQHPLGPDGITVRDLVGRGRYPHQGFFRNWSERDESAVQRALEATRTRWSSPAATWMSSPAASANGSGSRWHWPRRPTSCCWMSPPPTWTSRTRWRSWTSSRT